MSVTSPIRPSTLSCGADLYSEYLRYWKTVIWMRKPCAAMKILWNYERIESLWHRGEVIIYVDH